jgi:hypothetical protein
MWTSVVFYISHENSLWPHFRIVYLRVCTYRPGATNNRSGRTFVPRLSEDASVSVAGDNKVYSAPIQSIKEKLWSQESCKLNRSMRLAFARSANSRSVKINH